MSGKKLKMVLLAGITVFFFVLGACLLQAGEAAAAAKTAAVTGSVVNVRSGPGTGYTKVGSVKKGDRLEALEEKNGWYKLKLANGTSGWVIGSYLNVSGNTSTGSTAPAPANSGTSGKTITVNTGRANVRSGPGTGYGKVTQVNRGQSFTVLKESGGWYSISLGSGRTGWIAGWLVAVKTNTPPANNGSGTGSGTGGANGSAGSGVAVTGTFLVVKGSTVNIRSGAGTSYGVIARVKAGDRLTALKKNGEWYQVNLSGGKQGWIAGWLTEVHTESTPSRGGTDRPSDTDPSNQPEPKPENPGPGPETPVLVPPQKLSNVEFNKGENGEELLVIKSEGAIKYSASLLKDPSRLVIDINNCDVNGLKDLTAGGTLVSAARIAQYSLTPMTVRVVLDLIKPVNYVPFVDESGRTLTITLSEPSIKGKVIVIDAGHGGYDPGASGVTGLQEKGFNLETALLLKEKLTALGATVVLTREGDDFISLTERTRVANSVYADAFVSIHANSSENSSVRGTSTYYYAPSSNPALYAQRDQRAKLAETVQDKLISALGTRDVGTLQANFAVLRGTNMPSILVETAFLSNTGDEALLKDSQFRDKVAQGIADGLSEYFTNPY